MKTISIFLALINSLLAGLLLTFWISGGDIHHAPTWWSLLRILAAGTVILIGLFTWADGIFSLPAELMALSSLALVALGAVTTVWTFHRAQLTGDMEYYMVLYGGSLFFQGAALLFGRSQDKRTPSAA